MSVPPEASNGPNSDPPGQDAAETTAPTAIERELEDLREALRAAAARERLLAHELQHRVRNMLAVLRSIYRRTLERGASQDEFAEHFGGRLGAIARYQTGIGAFGAGGIDLEEMVRNELLDVQCVDGPRCTIAGPPVRLRQKWCELMGLALHELTTNAIKFGALRHDGILAIEWSLVGPPAQTTLHFRWKETGVPLVSTAPRPHGFGQDLIEDALPYQLGATTSFDFKPGGFECSIAFPLPAPDSSLSPERYPAEDSPPFPSDADWPG